MTKYPSSRPNSDCLAPVSPRKQPISPFPAKTPNSLQLPLQQEKPNPNTPPWPQISRKALTSLLQDPNSATNTNTPRSQKDAKGRRFQALSIFPEGRQAGSEGKSPFLFPNHRKGKCPFSPKRTSKTSARSRGQSLSLESMFQSRHRQSALASHRAEPLQNELFQQDLGPKTPFDGKLPILANLQYRTSKSPRALTSDSPPDR